MVFVQGARIIPLVELWSATTIRVSFPPDGGRSVMKSMVTVTKGFACGFTAMSMRGGDGGMCVDLGLLAHGTTLYVVLYKDCHTGPPVVPSKQFKGSKLSWMAHRS